MHSRDSSPGPSVPSSRAYSHRRRRTLSVVSVSSASSDTVVAKILITVPPQNRPHASASTSKSALALGSFSLLGSAREALLDVAFPTASPTRVRFADGDDGDGEESSGDERLATRRALPRLQTRLRSRSNSTSDTDASVPSISRTSSPFQERPSIPPGWGAYPRSATTSYTSFSRPRARTHVGMNRTYSLPHSAPPAGDPDPNDICGIHPVLESLERGSRVGTGRIACAGCQKVGANFPRCKHCAQMWCSRDCRTSALHRCAALKPKLERGVTIS
ncbi:hypothetical protein MKEN_00864800 [Mycena kentingensis (nom. inval.)]|nr:hypothetical protein MKEN_00864800 [Mycena kentingensis (nom. inval.)]